MKKSALRWTKICWIFFTLFLSVMPIAWPLTTTFEMEKVGNYQIEKNFQAGNLMLNLNGAGIRTKFFMDIYIGALYLDTKNNDASKILEANGPMAIRIKVISSKLTSDKIKDACEEGIKKATAGNTNPYKDQIQQFNLMFKDKVEKNDTFDFTYLPGKGILGYKNGKLLQTMPGKEFKKVLFSIWLGEHPADSDLKKKMLSL